MQIEGDDVLAPDKCPVCDKSAEGPIQVTGKDLYREQRGGVSPKFYPISDGWTPEEAIDRAIQRYDRKHGTLLSTPSEPPVCVLEVRGWVS
jgi:hypothetical protein